MPPSRAPTSTAPRSVPRSPTPAPQRSSPTSPVGTSSTPTASSLPVLVVPEPRAVLGAVAARIYGTEDLALRMVGITGTNGKTTTAYLVHSALGAMD